MCLSGCRLLHVCNCHVESMINLSGFYICLSAPMFDDGNMVGLCMWGLPRQRSGTSVSLRAGTNVSDGVPNHSLGFRGCRVTDLVLASRLRLGPTSMMGYQVIL